MRIKPGLYYANADSDFNLQLIYILGYYVNESFIGGELDNIKYVYYYYDFFTGNRGNFCGENCPFAQCLVPVTDEKIIKAAERTMAKKLSDYKLENRIYYEIDDFLSSNVSKDQLCPNCGNKWDHTRCP